MNPRDVVVAETREWLERSRSDLRASSALIAAGLPSAAVFHAQQCAEKAIKALLVWHQIPFKKTHDLEELKQACRPLDPSVTSQLEGIGRLSPYAWRFRYPGTSYLPEQAEAEEAWHGLPAARCADHASRRTVCRLKEDIGAPQ